MAGAIGRRLAVERLRRAILAGEMAPGQRLVEEELAGMLGVTRASLRASLFDLAADGLVERIPNRGARVRAVTLDEAVAITECRMALEGLCAAKAAERVTEPDAARLRQLGEEMRRCVAAGELLKYSALNHELHRLVREISGQAVATSLLERLNGQLVRHQFQLSLRPGRPQASLPEHLAIIAAVAGRRPGRGGGRHPPPPEQRHLVAARPATGPVPEGTAPESTVPEGGQVSQQESMLVVSAHAADFVWRAGGAAALAASRGDRVTVLCLSYGERGESASAWRAGKMLEEIKAQRRSEAESAAAALGAAIEFLDAGDYPLRETDELIDRIVRVYREVNPSVVLTHTLADPYNGDHPAAGQMALRARVLAQAVGYPAPGEPIGAPPVFLFEPHQPEMCGFKPEVLLDITPVFDAKRKAMECMGAQQHLWEYYTDLARRRGTQLRRNAGPNLGLPSNTMGEAYMRVFPHVTDRLS